MLGLVRRDTRPMTGYLRVGRPIGPHDAPDSRRSYRRNLSPPRKTEFDPPIKKLRGLKESFHILEDETAVVAPPCQVSSTPFCTPDSFAGSEAAQDIDLPTPTVARRLSFNVDFAFTTPCERKRRVRFLTPRGGRHSTNSQLGNERSALVQQSACYHFDPPADLCAHEKAACPSSPALYSPLLFDASPSEAEAVPEGQSGDGECAEVRNGEEEATDKGEEQESGTAHGEEEVHAEEAADEASGQEGKDVHSENEEEKVVESTVINTEGKTVEGDVEQTPEEEVEVPLEEERAEAQSQAGEDKAPSDVDEGREDPPADCGEVTEDTTAEASEDKERTEQDGAPAEECLGQAEEGNDEGKEDGEGNEVQEEEGKGNAEEGEGHEDDEDDGKGNEDDDEGEDYVPKMVATVHDDDTSPFSRRRLPPRVYEDSDSESRGCARSRRRSRSTASRRSLSAPFHPTSRKGRNASQGVPPSEAPPLPPRPQTRPSTAVRARSSAAPQDRNRPSQPFMLATDRRAMARRTRSKKDVDRCPGSPTSSNPPRVPFSPLENFDAVRKIGGSIVQENRKKQLARERAQARQKAAQREREMAARRTKPDANPSGVAACLEQPRWIR